MNASTGTCTVTSSVCKVYQGGRARYDGVSLALCKESVQEMYPELCANKKKGSVARAWS